MSTNSCTSPIPSVLIFPISKETRAPSSLRLKAASTFKTIVHAIVYHTNLCCQRLSYLAQYLTPAWCRNICRTHKLCLSTTCKNQTDLERVYMLHGYAQE